MILEVDELLNKIIESEPDEVRSVLMRFKEEYPDVYEVLKEGIYEIV